MVIVEKGGFSKRQLWLPRLKDYLCQVKVGLFPTYPTIHFIRSQEVSRIRSFNYLGNYESPPIMIPLILTCPHSLAIRNVRFSE